MNKITLCLIALILVLTAYLFHSQREIHRLTQAEELFRSKEAIAKALREDVADIVINVDCYSIHIKERFGQAYSWSIPIDGLVYDVGETYIIFRNERERALGRSWFPKREEGGSSGGAGNSVSESMLEYKLNLPDNGRVISVASHVKHIKRVCR